jgi:protein-disulfide isomerase
MPVEVKDAELTLEVGKEDQIAGSPEAIVSLVAYGDFQCPHCLKAHSAVKEIQEMLWDELLFTYRHFPIASTHPFAEQAAEAAEAAGAQGKFWQMYDLLFDNQDSLDTESLVTFAEQLELDVDQFKSDLESRKFVEKVRRDYESGVESGVTATPTFFINGKRFEGTPDQAELLEAIQDALVH